MIHPSRASLLAALVLPLWATIGVAGARSAEMPIFVQATDGVRPRQAIPPSRPRALPGDMRPDRFADPGRTFSLPPSRDGGLAAFDLDQATAGHPATPPMSGTLKPAVTPHPASPAPLFAGEDTPPVPQPGLFAPVPVEIPGPLLKAKTVAPHTPDVEVEVARRTSLGLFGEVSRTVREDIRTSTVREGRDLEAGVTLQYKFGTQ